MAAPFPAAHLANLLTLPARHFAVVDAGGQRARILFAAVTRGRPQLLRSETVDAHEEGFTTTEEIREEVRRRLKEANPEAVVVVAPPYQILRQVLDVASSDPAVIRAAAEREASSIGGLSDTAWAFDAVRQRDASPMPAGSHAPVIAAFCRQEDRQQLLSGYTEAEELVFDIVPAGDALAAAFRAAQPATQQAILVDLGHDHTGVTLMVRGAPVSCIAFPVGSRSFTEALAADRAGSFEAAEVLKRTEPPPALPAGGHPHYAASIAAWLAELERSVREWADEHPETAAGHAAWPAFLAGGGALQPNLPESLAALGPRRFQPWPAPPGVVLRADFATAWGALLLGLHRGPPAPSLLPQEIRAFWGRQRVWRALLSTNLALVAMLGVALLVAMLHQSQRLAAKAEWQRKAATALQQAKDIRAVAEGFNARMDAFRPVLERQRQTVETLQSLGVIQRQRTNANHWYVLLADSISYASGSNNFNASPPPPRQLDPRASTTPYATATNSPPPARAIVAEICLVPQGEQMRQALSELVGELKRYPLFRNVDALPPERRRELVSSNLVFAERHFALELNLSEAELLPPIPIPRSASTNREPRTGFRQSSLRNDATNASPRLPRATR